MGGLGQRSAEGGSMKPFEDLTNIELDDWTLRLDRATSILSSTDFWALPSNSYVFIPTREHWPASVVNARLPMVEGTSPARWLMQNRAVEQVTWSPGEPMIIEGRLVAEGGWINRDGTRCFNYYRPPQIEPGNPELAGPWIDHVKLIYPEDAAHIILWLAHRVQRPAEKINHALVLGGAQGIGKDTLLAPVREAVGPWNFDEVSPTQVMGRFNGYLKSVVLRVNEARDLGIADRFKFYDHLKPITASPPETLKVDEKNIREHRIFNVCGVIITTNHKTDGIYLPADDRRHYVAWSDHTKEQFGSDYWQRLWCWYQQGGLQHVAAYLAKLDLSSLDPKAPPPKTPAFWDIVNASHAPEDAELADALDRLGNPPAVTLDMVRNVASAEFQIWWADRKNRRSIPHRFERCDYCAVRNEGRKDGLWIINGTRQVLYARTDLSIRDRFLAAQRLQRTMP
jgi:hypothetical protein